MKKIKEDTSHGVMVSVYRCQMNTYVFWFCLLCTNPDPWLLEGEIQTVDGSLGT